MKETSEKMKKVKLQSTENQKWNPSRNKVGFRDGPYLSCPSTSRPSNSFKPFFQHIREIHVVNGYTWFLQISRGWKRRDSEVVMRWHRRVPGCHTNLRILDTWERVCSQPAAPIDRPNFLVSSLPVLFRLIKVTSWLPVISVLAPRFSASTIPPLGTSSVTGQACRRQKTVTRSRRRIFGALASSSTATPVHSHMKLPDMYLTNSHFLDFYFSITYTPSSASSGILPSFLPSMAFMFVSPGYLSGTVGNLSQAGHLELPALLCQ